MNIQRCELDNDQLTRVWRNFLTVEIAAPATSKRNSRQRASVLAWEKLANERNTAKQQSV